MEIRNVSYVLLCSFLCNTVYTSQDYRNESHCKQPLAPSTSMSEIDFHGVTLCDCPVSPKGRLPHADCPTSPPDKDGMTPVQAYSTTPTTPKVTQALEQAGRTLQERMAALVSRKANANSLLCPMLKARYRLR